MRKIILFLSVVLLMATVWSCKKATTYPVTEPVPYLPGKWYLYKSTKNIYFYGSPVFADTLSTYTANDYIQFNNDGSGVITDTLPGMPNHNFNYIYTPKDSLHVFLYQYLNTDSATVDTMAIKSFTLTKLSWLDSFTYVSIDLTQTNTYGYYFTKSN